MSILKIEPKKRPLSEIEVLTQKLHDLTRHLKDELLGEDDPVTVRKHLRAIRANRKDRYRLMLVDALAVPEESALMKLGASEKTDGKQAQ